MEELYWSTFYQCPDESIQGPSLFAKNVGSWLVSKYSANDVNILELGCGNCRDSCYLSELGYNVTAVDTAVKATVEDNLTKKKANVLDFLRQTQDTYNVIYMRWFLHAVPYEQQKVIIQLASEILKPNGVIFIENRSLNDNILLENSVFDPSDESFSTSHKRWPSDPRKLKEVILNVGLTVESCVESRGFSPSGTRNYNKDPLLLRLVARKAS